MAKKVAAHFAMLVVGCGGEPFTQGSGDSDRVPSDAVEPSAADPVEPVTGEAPTPTDEPSSDDSVPAVTPPVAPTLAPDDVADDPEVPLEPVQTEREPGLLEELIPFQQWPDLESEAIGLLYVGRLHAQMHAFDHGLFAKESEQSDRYRFGANGSSPYVLYFESSGDGYNFLPDFSVPIAEGGEATYEAAQFGPDDLARWDVSKPVHLVKLDVNDGQGGSRLHFVATGAEVLDGSAEYPFDPTELISDAAVAAGQTFGISGFDLMLEVERDQAELALGSSAEQSVELEMVSSVTGFWPTWDEAEQRLRVVFAQREAAQWVALGELVTDAPDCPPGAPCALPEPMVHATVSSFGLEQAIVYEFDASGRQVDRTEHPPRPVAYSGVTETTRPSL